MSCRSKIAGYGEIHAGLGAIHTGPFAGIHVEVYIRVGEIREKLEWNTPETTEAKNVLKPREIEFGVAC
ncbi:hypothetical protein L914_17744 [Phytophthora nicotianae]|uniref:Uncharacterized protein n=1 Tax=Phytophthora nicotianae TaxID=4792 RepID=W2MG60_PHYNI|nr:hypothetical protein L914_17744 [Phytophthora nicotianae]